MMGSDFEPQGEQEQPPAPPPEPAPAPPPPMYQQAPPPMYQQPPPMAPPMKPQTIKPVLGGVLLIVAAILGMLLGVAIMGALDAIPMGMLEEYFAEDTTGTVESSMNFLQDILTVCGAIFLIFSILALLGGIMAITRKSWGFAVMGSIFGLLSLGLFGLGSILSIVALILIVISKDEF